MGVVSLLGMVSTFLQSSSIILWVLQIKELNDELILFFFACRCIPYRNISGVLEVLVITSQKGQGMMFPKVGNF